MPGVPAPFRPLLRAVFTLLLLGPALAFTCWLVLTCADFLGVVHFGRGLTRPWADFALRTGLGVLLPPALLAGLDQRRPWLLRLREACRASLITFAAFALAFFAVGALLAHYGSPLQAALVPVLLNRIGPLVMCLLLYLSYRLTMLMLPLPEPEGPPPAPVRLFAGLGGALALFPVVQALAPASPLGLPALDPSLYDQSALPQDVFLFATLVWLIGRRGLRVFRPVYVGICILGPVLTLLEPGVYPLPWQVFHALRLVLSLMACVCLYTPPARRWLVA